MSKKWVRRFYNWTDLNEDTIGLLNGCLGIAIILLFAFGQEDWAAFLLLIPMLIMGVLAVFAGIGLILSWLR